MFVDGVLITIEHESKMLVGEHQLPLPYGKIVRMAFDAAIIPAIDPTAHNLVDLLDHLVNCSAVGANISSALGVGSSAFWASACTAGLQGAANLVYDQIAAQNSLLTFDRLGTVRVSDSDGDHKLDKLQFGEWSGMVSYDGTATVMAQPATFEGARK